MREEARIREPGLDDGSARARTAERNLRRSHTRGWAWKLAYAAAFCVLAWMTLWNLGEFPVRSFDEARHAVNAYEMLRNGNLLVNTYEDAPDMWNLKPPLSFWAVMAGYRVLGLNAWGLRVPMAACYLAMAAMLAAFARRRLGAAEGLAVLVASLGMTRPMAFHFARSGDPDALYLLLLCAAMLCLSGWRRKRGLVYPTGLLISLAFLAKSWHALAMLPVVAAYLALTGQIRGWRAREVLGFLGCAVAPPLLWALARTMADGNAGFVASALGYDLVARGSTVIEGHAERADFYPRVVLGDYGCLAVVALALGTWLMGRLSKRALAGGSPSDHPKGQAGAGSRASKDSETDPRGQRELRDPLGRREPRGQRDRSELRELRDLQILAAAWVLVPFACYQLAASKIYHYVFCIWPALMLVAALATHELLALRPRLSGPRQAATLAGVAGCLVVLALGVRANAANALAGATPGSADMGSNPALQLALEQAADELPRGVALYYQDSPGNQATTDMSQDGVAVAEWTSDAHVRPGGIAAFLASGTPATLVLPQSQLGNHPELRSYASTSHGGFAFVSR